MITVPIALLSKRRMVRDIARLVRLSACRRTSDQRERLLARAFVLAMDIDADGGVIPKEIEPLFNKDRLNNLTLQEEDMIISWFENTAPGSFS